MQSAAENAIESIFFTQISRFLQAVPSGAAVGGVGVGASVAVGVGDEVAFSVGCVLSIAGFGIPHQFFSPVTT